MPGILDDYKAVLDESMGEGGEEAALGALPANPLGPTTDDGIGDDAGPPAFMQGEPMGMGPEMMGNEMGPGEEVPPGPEELKGEEVSALRDLLAQRAQDRKERSMYFQAKAREMNKKMFG